ncbi:MULTISPECIES: archaeosine biosynthesis radical SAM protein RaSEA [unclassified Methanoculleus]|uniref:archaeosine biosynthesis radical SAM protein RaSEA n=1 Tax=unclassified Methanoculleus TaxID=2619537 RepID=UPI0025F50E7D|nr:MULTISPECIES: archaeosine biosynthesis radical SAM protein RaSEA [unclassified Methanoculleus]MCK9316765.1 archaeosine biosynthesis radical SAM protein RaSEA [Methanoculleus sp.]MDD2252774.1 archaeosine biosynthesis radical SAM protein RaSEA [Methanoculleus sp.]MDD2788656.1 archaeosine biosynthesis radical SAM protein RaSEA [Methanoculleus sp.]MDD3215243.1 archaeosine biosynthesis radical SAM protein RaSEA [Methanoculleus sp.]MDD4313017.1 archaeosine biosynthesis radical SAM protein RaSEA [
MPEAGGIIILDKAVPDSGSNAEIFTSLPTENDVLGEIRALAGGLRRQNGGAPEDLDFTVPIGWEERVGYLDGQPTRRLIIFLRSTGCEWVEKTGGCTMCGFYCATSRGREVSAAEYVAQFEHVMNTVDLGDYPIVSIYNDGNIFNEREMPVAAIEKICSYINGYPNIKKVVVESRIDYSPDEHVQKMKKALNGRQLEVAFGFESADTQVMNLCINKGFSASNFDHFHSRMRGMGVLTKPLLLVKPPFLTEAEGINDILRTIAYCISRGIDYVDLEVMTVEKNTVVHELWKNNLYRPPWLWSLVDLLQRCQEQFGDHAHIYVSPWNYSVESLDWARNCGKCDAEVTRAIERYNCRFDVGEFEGLDCSCRGEGWREAVLVEDSRTIPERIREQLAYIRQARVSAV